MNHSFVLTVGSDKCAKCRRPEIDHTDHAVCEACPNIGPCQMYPDVNGILLCQSCIDREEMIRNSESSQIKRVEEMKADATTRMEAAQSVDRSIQMRSDVFNAQTVSIIELKQIIDVDTNIKPEEKHFALAKVLTERLNQFKKAIFEKNEEMVNMVNQQRAVQTYLNDLANKLRKEQREEIHLRDVSFPVAPIKSPTKPRNSGAPTKKFDKTEVRKFAALAGMPDSVIQMTCIAKNITPEQAYKLLTGAVASIENK